VNVAFSSVPVVDKMSGTVATSNALVALPRGKVWFVASKIAPMVQCILTSTVE
jgi:hypothetical protein